MNCAEKKGYSGTLVYAKEEPLNVIYDIADEGCDEGRVITLEYPDFYFVTAYVPNSKDGLLRLDFRMEWEDALRRHLMELDKKKPVIYTGDLNVAHEEIDLKNPDDNHLSAGFSDEERAKFTELLSAGFSDSFRTLYPSVEKYTWWSYRTKARERNVGWRIDYFVVSERLMKDVKDSLIYDEIGSMVFINRDFVKNMEHRGINCRIFNPIAPTINVLMNNRDHRKITVIDGVVSFTGGFNLADEYFNLVSPYGYWKDTGVKIRGKASQNLTTIFLEMWNQIKQTDTVDQIKGFLESSDLAQDYECRELVQPYADTPLDTESVGRNVYLNVISAAKKYIYISTPYLIVDDETSAALTLAAGRGVDVRILIPEIPDKKIVYRATLSYSTLLAQSNVKIYKFSGGFNHAKQVVCDDEIACCGTINFDYRSLYFHFENGVLFTSPDAVASMKKDFIDTFAKSSDETENFKLRMKRRNILYDNIIRLISPLF